MDRPSVVGEDFPEDDLMRLLSPAALIFPERGYAARADFPERRLSTRRVAKFKTSATARVVH
jgi:hypothetical protein